MKIGLISDTHGYLDPAVLTHFNTVDHILHAGDIGPQSIILSLEKLAPVTAVTGNTDYGLPYAEHEIVELGGLTFLVHHIVDLTYRSDTLKRLLERHKPDVVVYGHTHKAASETVDSVRFINPGYAGKQRFRQPRSIAVVKVSATSLSDPEFIAL